MGEGGDISKHLSEYNQICDEIRTLKRTISEEQKAWGTLLLLPPSWRVTVVQIANRYKDKANGMTYRDVRGDLLLEREFNKAYDTSSSSKLDEAKALFTKGPPARNPQACFHCGNKEHIKKDCRKLKAKQRNNWNDRNDWNDRSDCKNDRNSQNHDRQGGNKGYKGRNATAFTTNSQMEPIP